MQEFFAAHTTSPDTFRARDEFAEQFGDRRLVEPGVVRTPEWRPAPGGPSGWDPVRAGCWAGVAVRD